MSELSVWGALKRALPPPDQGTKNNGGMDDGERVTTMNKQAKDKEKGVALRLTL